MADYLLGIDNGSTVSKAAIFDITGKEIAVSSRKTRLITPQPGYAERDMEEIWISTLEAIKEVLENSNLSAKSIKGIGCTGHGNGLYLINNAGKPIRNAIMSTDLRAKAYISQWQDDSIDVQVRSKTMQSIWPAQPNSLLAWLKDYEPDSIKKTKWILMCKDYIRFKLTGKVYGELTDMSGTSLLNLQTKNYDSELLDMFGIGDIRELLPPLIESEKVAGYITQDVAKLTGLIEGTPVAAGMFDIDACGLALGMVNESKLCMIAGTWGNNQYISKNPVISDKVFMTSCYSIPEYYLMLEGSATSTNNLEWFLTEFLEDANNNLNVEDKSIYDYCNELVVATSPTDANIVFLPFLYGSNSHPNAKACFLGIDAWHNKGHILRAVYEGTVFSHKSHVDSLLNFRDMPETIQLTGGATKSDEWIQIFANTFQVPIEIPRGTELGALGAAIAAGVAVGTYSNFENAVKSMVKISRIVEPASQNKSLYEQKYNQYKKAIELLNDFWSNQ